MHNIRGSTKRLSLETLARVISNFSVKFFTGKLFKMSSTLRIEHNLVKHLKIRSERNLTLAAHAQQQYPVSCNASPR